MSEDLIVIRAFASELEADAVQAALQAAGVQSLVVSGSGGSLAAQAARPEIGIAVHRRDVDRAEAVLSAPPARPS